MDILGRATATGLDAGECRCNPPETFKALGGNFRQWPATLSSDECGCHELAEPVVAVKVAESAPVILPVAEPVVADEPVKRGRPKKVVDPQ